MIRGTPHPTILIVDDSAAERLLIQRQLTEVAGGEVCIVSAAGPGGALRAALECAIDLALVDYSLGAAITGFELQQRLERMGIQACLFSNHIALERGASWIAKPDLARHLPRLLGAARARAAARGRSKARVAQQHLVAL